MKNKFTPAILFFLMVTGVFFLVKDEFENPGRRTSNPPGISSKIGKIPCPKGYKRVEYPQGSYSGFLRSLPVKITDKIKDYKGKSFSPAFPIFGVVDLPFLFPGQNLEQCADWAMRLWAEYHRRNGKLEELYLFDYSGKKIYLARSGLSYKEFLRRAFAFSNSYSLKMGCQKIRKEDLRPGDMIINNKSGSVGHLSVILDVCTNQKGDKVYLLGYSFIPAQQIRIVRSMGTFGPEGWFTLKGMLMFLKPFSIYGEPVYRRFPEDED